MSSRQRSYMPRSRAIPEHCERCDVKRPPNRLYCYVDGNNGSITANSPYLCYECYVARYGPQQRPPQEQK